MTNSLRPGWRLVVATAFGALAASVTAVFAQQAAQPRIASISVAAPIDVLGPHGEDPVNTYGGLSTLSDEHQTVLPPNTLPFQSQYLFLVASRTNLQPAASGLVFLQAVGLPVNDQWTLDYAPLYGLYNPAGVQGSRNGPVFATAMDHASCPSSGIFDPTFDLNYAAPSTAFLDPTNPLDQGGGNFLLVYEGTNRCVGLTGASIGGNSFFSTVGIATSADFGHTFPTYASNFTPLPGVNPSSGPMAPLGAWGSDVCWGNFCSSINVLQPPPQYGRYAVLGPVTTVQAANDQSAGGLTMNVGDSEPSAFVDGSRGGNNAFVYVVQTYNPGGFAANTPVSETYPQVAYDLTVGRAMLHGGRTRLRFQHWDNGRFTEPGLGSDGGGNQTPIFTDLGEDFPHYQQCLGVSQNRSSGAIYYSEATREYVLMFVCASPTDPLTDGKYRKAAVNGAAWFYSTMPADLYDLSRQDMWSAPSEIRGSWSTFTGQDCNANFNGWYPTAMSMNADPGHLQTTGYVFSMSGCESQTSSRAYVSRVFTITTQ